MHQPILISGTFPNIQDGVTTEDFLNYISFYAENIEIYKMSGGGSAAFDWRTILHDVAAFAGIASFIWLAYTELIVSKNSDTCIHIVIGDPNNELNHFRLGDEYKEKEIFIKSFNQRITKLIKTDNKEVIINEIIETQQSSHWVKIR